VQNLRKVLKMLPRRGPDVIFQLINRPSEVEAVWYDLVVLWRSITVTPSGFLGCRMPIRRCAPSAHEELAGGTIIVATTKSSSPAPRVTGKLIVRSSPNVSVPTCGESSRAIRPIRLSGRCNRIARAVAGRPMFGASRL
jgi:hypothetical protein